MRIASSLVQHYFLEVNPNDLEAVEQELVKPSTPDNSLRHAGQWRLFSWLDRPAIWAIRPVKRTSGLDVFLFDDHGLAGVTDVAELINFPIMGQETDCLLPDWDTFSPKLKGPGILCATFIWPDWDTLYCPETWGGTPPPTRSQILEAIRSCLLSAIPKAAQQPHGLLSQIPPLLLTASAGDADLILYSWINNSADLDSILLILSVMETDALATQLGRNIETKKWPVFRTTQTEMALDLALYQKVRAAARTDALELKDDLSVTLDACFAGDLFAEVGLARGRGSLSDLKDGLKKNAPGWEERAVFGGEDLVLAPESGRSLSFNEVIRLLARLEVMASTPGFPRRSSLRVGVMNAVGRTSSPLTASNIYGVTPAPATAAVPPASFIPNFASVDLKLVRKTISELSDIRWREDVRIIERMIERCVTLQKSPSLSRETRRMAAQALERIVRCCREIRELESALEDLIQKAESVPLTDVEKKKSAERRVEETCIDIRIKRDALLNTGMALDRALSHHSKGVVALLLHPASQARGAEHIGSEVGLSLGMGAMFQSAARRMSKALPAGTGDEEKDVILNQLKESLRDIQYPTVYASHDPDFSINASMALLRIPRWALWYPSASSHLMHEFGHALASIGTLSYLLKAVSLVLGEQGHQNSEVMQAQLAFLQPFLQPFPEADESIRKENSAKKTFIAFITKHILEAKNNNHRNEMDEITCDIVSRLLAYPPGAEWDRRWLVDTFEYTLPFAGRCQPDFIQTRFLRLLAAFLAVRLLRKGLFNSDTTGTNSRLKSLAHIQEEMRKNAESFGQEIAQWQERLKQQKYPIPSYVSRSLSGVIGNILTRVGKPIFPRRTPDLESSFFYSSIIIALALSVRPIEDPKEVSGYKATQIWGRLMDVNRLQHTDTLSEDESVEIKRIIDALTENRIPPGALNHIEYLPSLLAEHYESQNNRVPPSVRVALSFYLYDNYHFNG